MCVCVCVRLCAPVVATALGPLYWYNHIQRSIVVVQKILFTEGEFIF